MKALTVRLVVILCSFSSLGASAPSFAQTTVAPVIVTAPHPKYLTDTALREGMVGVQNAVVAQYFAACALGPKTEAYVALADALDRSADAMRLSNVTGSSKVEVSDLVDRLSRGSGFLRSEDDRQVGVREAVAVLVDYSTDFSHPGWRPSRPSRSGASFAEPATATLTSASPVDEVAVARAGRRIMCKRLAGGTAWRLWR